MKKFFAVFLIGGLLTACNETGTTNTEVKLEAIGEKIDTTAEKIGDSIKAKGGRLVDKIENAVERGRDSLRTDNDTTHKNHNH